MALVQIQIAPGERVVWAKESAAAKLVAQGKARYVITETAAEPDAAVEAPTHPRQLPKRGRR